MLLLTSLFLFLPLEAKAQATVVTLHTFGDGTVANDGFDPFSLVLGSDGNFYGVTYAGGAGNEGSVFKMTTDGDEVVLHSFRDGTTPEDGQNPSCALVQGLTVITTEQLLTEGRAAVE